MIKWRIANPIVGEFTWELPKEMQELLFGLPVEGQRVIEQYFCNKIEEILNLLQIMLFNNEMAEFNFALFEDMVDGLKRILLLQLEAFLQQEESGQPETI